MALIAKLGMILEAIFFGWLASGLSKYAARKAQADLWIPTRQCTQCGSYTMSNGLYCSFCQAPLWAETDPRLEATLKRARITSK